MEVVWWVWRSWLARQIVALEAEGSTPFTHPIFSFFTMRAVVKNIFYRGLSADCLHTGAWPSG